MLAHWKTPRLIFRCKIRKETENFDFTSQFHWLPTAPKLQEEFITISGKLRLALPEAANNVINIDHYRCKIKIESFITTALFTFSYFNKIY